MNTAAIPDDYSLALPYPVTAAIIDQSMTDILEPFDQWQRSEHTEAPPMPRAAKNQKELLPRGIRRHKSGGYIVDVTFNGERRIPRPRPPWNRLLLSRTISELSLFKRYRF